MAEAKLLLSTAQRSSVKASEYADQSQVKGHLAATVLMLTAVEPTKMELQRYSSRSYRHPPPLCLHTGGITSFTTSMLANYAQNRHIPDVVPSEVRGAGFFLARAAAVLAASKASRSFSFLLFRAPLEGPHLRLPPCAAVYGF